MTRRDKQLWHTMLAQSFLPGQWFNDEADNQEHGDFPMWVYRMIAPGRWAVGYYTPDKEWVEDTVHDSSSSAAARVNYLNGGKQG